MADDFVAKLSSFLSARRSPLAPYAGLIYSTARRQYPQNPKLLAGLVAGIAGGEQSFGAAQNPDTQDHFNLWGWGHPPSGLTSTGMFGSWQEGIGAVSRGLAKGYLSQGLTRPDQIYGRYVKGDPVSTARGGGYSADWTRTVSDTLARLGVGPASGVVSSAPSAALATAPPASAPSLAAAAPARAAPDLNALFALINSNNQLIGLPPLAFSPPAPVVPSPTAPAAAASAAAPPRRSRATSASSPTVPKPSKGQVQLPASFKSDHETSGLAGFPALDVFAPAGTTALSPTAGTIVSVRDSGVRDTDDGGPGVLGIHIRIRTPSGGEYWMTHFGSALVKKNQRIRKGQPLGTVAHHPRGDHIHVGKNF